MHRRCRTRGQSSASAASVTRGVTRHTDTRWTKNVLTLTVTRQHRSVARVRRSPGESARSARKVCTQGLHARSARKVCTDDHHRQRERWERYHNGRPATALLLAGHVATELVARRTRHDRRAVRPLRHVRRHEPVKVAERLTFVSTPPGTAEMGRRGRIAPGPARQSPLGSSWWCCGAGATWACGRSRPVHVARTIDVGLLVARFHRLPEFNTLRRDLNGLATLMTTTHRPPIRPPPTRARRAQKRPSRASQTCPFR